MRLANVLRPLAFLLFLGAAAGCAVEDDSPAAVSEERLTRIKSAFTASKAEDFKPIEPIVDPNTVTGWNVDARDVQAYVWVLDGTNVYVISFEADTRAVLEGIAPSPSNPHESFLLFLDSTADASSLTSAALYREDAKEWVQAATRVMAETHPPPPAVDGGVPTIAGPIDAGIDANVDSGLDGGVVDGGPVDGGPPTDAPTDATADAPKDGATDAPSDAPTDAKADAPG